MTMSIIGFDSSICPHCHDEKYNNLKHKIQIEFDSWRKDAEIYGDKIMDMNEPRLLKSLLENEK